MQCAMDPRNSKLNSLEETEVPATPGTQWLSVRQRNSRLSTLDLRLLLSIPQQSKYQNAIAFTQVEVFMNYTWVISPYIFFSVLRKVIIFPL